MCKIYSCKDNALVTECAVFSRTIIKWVSLVQIQLCHNKMGKNLSFASNLVPLIENQEKTLTYRLGNKYNFLNVGDKIKVSNSSSGKIFGEIEIQEKQTKDFLTLPLDLDGHEKYASKEEQRKVFEGYYLRPIHDSDQFLIFKFKFISR